MKAAIPFGWIMVAAAMRSTRDVDFLELEANASTGQETPCTYVQGGNMCDNLLKDSFGPYVSNGNVLCVVLCATALGGGACQPRLIKDGEKGVCRVKSTRGHCTPGLDWQCPVGHVCHTEDDNKCKQCSAGFEQSGSCIAAAAVQAADYALRTRGFKYSIVTNTVPQEGEAASSSVRSGITPLGVGGSSRSGAHFFITGDKDYLIKGLGRAEEYMELFKLSQVKRQKYPVLNHPAFCFPAFGFHWVAMPNTQQVFQRKLGLQPFGDVAFSLPSGKPEKFDIKPAPLISAERGAFFKKLRHVVADFNLGQFPAFMKALEADLETLTANKLVDYSWLIYRFEVAPGAVTVPDGTWCFITSEFHKTGYQQKATPFVDHIFCFELIDYSLAYDPNGAYFKRAENAVMGGKWTEYDRKFERLTTCIFQHPQTTDSINNELAPKHLEIRRAANPKVGTVEVTARLPYTPSDCMDYRAYMCESQVSEWSVNGNKCKGEVTFWRPNTVVKPLQQLAFCEAYMVEKCLEAIR